MNRQRNAQTRKIIIMISMLTVILLSPAANGGSPRATTYGSLKRPDLSYKDSIEGGER